jgi:chemosensory pili system protein ChpB (putative protein-glutamate methylesterase)
MSNHSLAVGLLANTKQQLSELHRMVNTSGHRVVASLEHQPGQLAQLPPAQVWLVQLDLDCEQAQTLLDQLDDAGIPVIVADEDAPPANPGTDPNQLPEARRQARIRRLQIKLQQLVQPAQTASRQKRAEYVWVIAASTGGPDAIAQFLAAIPEPLPGVALVYAQHIEAGALPHLISMAKQHSRWQVLDTRNNQPIQEKCLYIASPEHGLDILAPGVLAPTKQPWRGRYTPSINQIIAKVARVYGAHGGAIVFTGMGDDGTQGCQLLHHLGGQVWAQSAASSAIDSMPQSVARLGYVQRQGTPKELASHLLAYHQPRST